MDPTFLTRPEGQRSTFERKYLERFGNTGDKRIGLPGLSPQLVGKQREMEAASVRLEEARAKFEQWKANFQRKRKEIEDQQQALAEQKKQLDAFTQHHIVELDKAKKREQEEAQKAREIEKDLASLTEREEKLREQNDLLTAELAGLQPYADYLQSVVESCQTFDNVEAILHRHEGLSNTRSEYLAKYQELMSHYGSDEARLSRELELQRNHLIDSTMKYNERIARIKQTKKANEYRNTKVVKDVQRIEDRNTELAAIKTSIITIYNRALNKSGASTMETQKKKGELTEVAMLEFIENRVLDLKDIIREANVAAQQPGGHEILAQSSQPGQVLLRRP
jgi:DNA repair exonuclease SbcCD ATPase subunit